MLERGILAALNLRQFGCDRLGQGVVNPAPLLSKLVTKDPIVKNGVKPASQISFRASQMPARERALKTILYQIVGTLAVAAHQRTRETSQAGYVLFYRRDLYCHRV